MRPAKPKPEILCAACKKPGMKAAMVKVSGSLYHPYRCVDIGLKALRRQLDLALVRMHDR